MKPERMAKYTDPFELYRSIVEEVQRYTRGRKICFLPLRGSGEGRIESKMLNPYTATITIETSTATYRFNCYELEEKTICYPYGHLKQILGQEQLVLEKKEEKKHEETEEAELSEIEKIIERVERELFMLGGRGEDQ